MALTVETKTFFKKHALNPTGFIEEDIQVSLDETESLSRGKSHSLRNIIRGGSLPKINIKQVIDHRLIGFQPNRRG